MTTSNKHHPLFTKYHGLWVQLEDAFEGEIIVKDKGEEYLKPTAGMVYDGMGAGQPGVVDYTRYKDRAVYPDDVRQAVETMNGLLHREPAVIELPSKLEPLRKKATNKGETLLSLLSRINQHQLTTGRLGLMMDVASGQGPGALPYISLYSSKSIVNWVSKSDEKGISHLQAVLLDESGKQPTEHFEWVDKNQFRIVRFDKEIPTQGVSDSVDLKGVTYSPYNIAGKSPAELPFVIINSVDLVPDPQRPPLTGLSNLCLAIYRQEADFRQALYLQSQDTLVVIGAKSEVSKAGVGKKSRVGAGARLNLPIGADAKYVGVGSSGLQFQQDALVNDKQKAADMGAKLLDFSASSSRASGEALKIRMASRTANLVTIARAGGQGLEEALKIAARWVGADPDEVSVQPNLDFINDELLAQEILGYAQAKLTGAPISLKTIHNQMRKHDITEFTMEQELELIANEGPIAGLLNFGGDPDKKPEEKSEETEK